jgi:hypothetical protein
MRYLPHPHIARCRVSPACGASPNDWEVCQPCRVSRASVFSAMLQRPLHAFACKHHRFFTEPVVDLIKGQHRRVLICARHVKQRARAILYRQKVIKHHARFGKPKLRALPLSVWGF